MQNFPSRMRAAVAHAGGNQSEIARRVSEIVGRQVSAQTIQYLCGSGSPDRKPPAGSRYTPAIAQACGVRVDWLASGNGPMLESEREGTALTVRVDTGSDVTVEELGVLQLFRRLRSPASRAAWVRIGKEILDAFGAQAPVSTVKPTARKGRKGPKPKNPSRTETV